MSWIDDLTDHQRKDFEWLIQGFNRNMPSSAHISLGCTVPQYAHKRAVQADVLWRDLKLMDEDELSTDTEIEDIATQLKLKQESQISKKRQKFGRAPSLVAYRSCSGHTPLTLQASLTRTSPEATAMVRSATYVR